MSVGFLCVLLARLDEFLTALVVSCLWLQCKNAFEVRLRVSSASAANCGAFGPAID